MSASNADGFARHRSEMVRVFQPTTEPDDFFAGVDNQHSPHPPRDLRLFAQVDWDVLDAEEDDLAKIAEATATVQRPECIQECTPT